MIRFVAESTVTLDPALEAFLEQGNEIVAQVGEDVTELITPLVLDELRFTPRKRVYPDEYPWTSDTQRKAYFATNGFGAGIPYKRSGGLSRAWKVEGRTDNGVFTLTLSNSAPGARFVVGSLAQSRAEAARFQQRFHALTGWPLAYDTAQFFVEAAEEEFERQVDERLGDLATVDSTRRAYTSPRRSV